jgi:hypothetical protein
MGNACCGEGDVMPVAMDLHCKICCRTTLHSIDYVRDYRGYARDYSSKRVKVCSECVTRGLTERNCRREFTEEDYIALTGWNVARRERLEKARAKQKAKLARAQ